MARQARYVVYPDHSGNWRWKKLAANNRTTQASGEAFFSKADAMHAAEREAGDTLVVIREKV